MSRREQLVGCLKALAERTPGGLPEIADQSGVSLDYLKQVIAGTKLQNSGRPRGLGPTNEQKIELRYPGWTELVVGDQMRATGTLEDALEIVGIALAAVPASVREAVGQNLQGWARDGGAEHWRNALLSLLASSGKQSTRGK